MNLANLLASGERFRHQQQMQSTITTSGTRGFHDSKHLGAFVEAISFHCTCHFFIVYVIDMPLCIYVWCFLVTAFFKKEETWSASSFFSRSRSCQLVQRCTRRSKSSSEPKPT
jgi:hypothetical protein